MFCRDELIEIGKLNTESEYFDPKIVSLDLEKIDTLKVHRDDNGIGRVKYRISRIPLLFLIVRNFGLL